MTDITPPPELVQQWMNEIYNDPYGDPHFVSSDDQALAALAAQWGADQELEACCAWLPKLPPWSADDLRRHRRQKPPSLKEQALALIDNCTDPHGDYLDDNALSTIRCALEQLPDDQG